MANVIELRGVTKRFGDVCALDGVDLTIAEGELFGLIGHNGAGKTTLFKLMLGLIAQSSGEIRVRGQSPAGRGFREARRALGYVPESVVFYDNLSGLETLRYFADLKGAPRTECVPALERVGLADAAGRRVKTYSKGMRQRLGLAQALLGKPSLLFLDEPTSGLDPEGIHHVHRLLRELRARGVTVVMASHILSEIQERVDRLAMLNHGRVQAAGTVQSLREAVDLPLWLEAKIVPAAMGAVRAALARLPVGEIRVNGDCQLAVQCRREAKMAVLAQFTALNGQVTDVQVREPTLEDVFLGRVE